MRLLFGARRDEAGRGDARDRRGRAGAIIAAAALLAPAIAQADPPPWAPAHGRRARDAEARYYAPPRPIGSDERIWRGEDGRYYCRRSNGTVGLVVGAAAGAVVGHELSRGDRTLGAVLGAAGGALIGRELDRGRLHCR